MMEKIWSDNKYINMFINVMLFLLGINFLHIGQLFLPVICFVLFIDNKFVFKVNKPIVFIVLSLFAISFYAFSYQMGFYSVMGFCLPMAYYVGSNIKYPTTDNIRKIIYLIGISMGLHVILNSITELQLHGILRFFRSSTHYDVWTRDKISNTATAINADIIIGSLYYLIFHEKNKKIRFWSIVVFVWSMFYLIVIGRRTPVLMLGLVFVFSFIYEAYFLKTISNKTRKKFSKLAISIISVVLLFVIIYASNIFNCRYYLEDYRIVQKFTKGFINDQRFELYFGSFALMPQYPFGGQHISQILGEQVHDLWIDIYDYAGIVTCLLMVVYSIMYAKSIYDLYKNKNVDNDLKLLMVGVYICIILQMIFEPVMTGASLFLIVSIIIGALLEKLTINE